MARKNFLKVPTTIQAKVAAFPGDDIVVAAVRRLTHAEVASGDWAHLGLSVQGEQITAAENSILPPPGRGRYSRANLEGYVRVRKDLPMVDKTYSVETPNWGDWSRGSHTMSWTRKVYQREFFPPNETAILIELLDELDGASDVKFTVDVVLDRTSATFEKDLLYALNLSQENVAAAEVFPSGATRADFLATTGVEWEILPPGEGDPIAKVFDRLNPTDDEAPLLQERMEFLVELAPRNFVTGQSGFQRYFGAQFGDDLVIFENLRRGNAIYAMRENWQQLSQRSRTELLNGDDAGFERVIHRDGWKRRVRGIVGHWRQHQAGGSGA